MTDEDKKRLDELLEEGETVKWSDAESEQIFGWRRVIFTLLAGAMLSGVGVPWVVSSLLEGSFRICTLQLVAVVGIAIVFLGIKDMTRLFRGRNKSREIYAITDRRLFVLKYTWKGGAFVKDYDAFFMPDNLHYFKVTKDGGRTRVTFTRDVFDEFEYGVTLSGDAKDFERAYMELKERHRQGVL